MNLDLGLASETSGNQKARHLVLPTDDLYKQKDWCDTINLLRGRHHKNEVFTSG